jgi:hypothetical protein
MLLKEEMDNEGQQIICEQILHKHVNKYFTFLFPL